MKKVISLLLSAVLLFSMILTAAFPSVALASANISFETKKFDTAAGNYSVINQANAGDTIYIVASLSHIDSFGGITLNLDYDTQLFSFDKSKSFTTIVDEKGNVFFNSNNGKISVIWETVSTDTTVNGAVFYIAIKVSDAVSADVNATFPATVIEMFDGSENQKTINCSVQNTASVKILTSVVPNKVLTLAEAVKTISYNPKNDTTLPKDSLSDIVAAESAFAGLTPSQQIAFRDNYPELYEALSTARTRYYRLAESQADMLISKEIEDFKKKFEDVLKLDVDKVTVNDKISVNFAYDWMNDILSKDAQKMLDDETKTKLTELYNKIKALEKEALEKEESASEVKDFKDTYGYMFTDSYIETFGLAYDVDGPIVLEALMVYESLLSKLAQNELSKEYKTLLELKGLIDKYTADDKAAAELLNKVADFQKRYAKVYTLNTNNVSIADKTAIEMVISAYDSLGADEAELKEKLKPRVLQLKSLLVVIEELEALQKEQNNSQKEETPKEETELPPQQNDTQSSQQPSADSEVLDDGSSNNVDGEISENTTPDASETVVTQTVTKWLNKNFVTESGLGWPTVVLLIMIAVSACCLIASAAISEYANNLNKRKDSAIDE